jgi:glycosyltransferase involved in cell wall biosynthesis
MQFAGRERLKIYFQVDEDQNFHPQKAAQTADIAFAINSEIFHIVQPHNPQCFLIPHSFQGHLSDLAKKTIAGDYTYRRNSGPLQVMYVGNLEHGHINIDLFEKTVKENNHVQFQLIGPYDPNRPLFKRLQHYPQVRFFGKVPYKEIPGLLDKADALMLVYDSGFTQSSHKLLEYLASGKAIVSTYMSEYDKDDSLIYWSKTDEEYLETFRRVLSTIELCNNPELMKARINFAMAHTYASQLDRIEKIIEQVIRK